MKESSNRPDSEAPERSKKSPQGTVFSGVFKFDPADPIYADHFPGRPVVPGTLTLAAFLKAAQASVPGIIPGMIQDFKFRSFILPGDYEYRLEHRENRLQCRLFHGGSGGGHPLVTGTILFRQSS